MLVHDDGVTSSEHAEFHRETNIGGCNVKSPPPIVSASPVPESPQKVASQKPEESESHAHPTSACYTPEQQKALSCLSELLGVVGALDDESSSKGTSTCMQPEEQKIPSQERMVTPSVVTPTTNTLPQQLSSAPVPFPSTETSKIESTPKARPATSNQRRSLFNVAKYQTPEENEDSSPRSARAMSIVPMIDRARPSTRKLLTLRSMSRSSPDLRSPQPGKSLLKQQRPGDEDGSVSSSRGGETLKRSGSNVSFGGLEIREYNVALSDHPDCSRGPPIQLGWEYFEQEPVSVDAYEERRSPRRRSLVHDPFRRSALLNEAGYTEEEVRSAMEDVHRVKQERLRVKGDFRRRRQQHSGVEGLVPHFFNEFFAGKNRRNERPQYLRCMTQ